MLSVIIPVYGFPPSFPALIGAILGQTFRDFEFIVVDDASSATDSARIRALHLSLGGGFQLVHLERNLGPAGARNAAVAKSKGDSFVFVDADCGVRSSRWLEQIAGMASSYPGAVLGFSIDGTGKSYAALCDRFCEWTNIPVRRSQRLSQAHLMTAHMVVPRGIWERLGGLDARLRTGEDTAFCFKAHRQGIPLYFFNHISVAHFDRERWADFLGNQFLLGRDRAATRAIAHSKVPWFLGAPTPVRWALVPAIAAALTLKHFAAWLRGDLRVILALPGLLAGMLALAAGVAVGRESSSPT